MAKKFPYTQFAVPGISKATGLKAGVTCRSLDGVPALLSILDNLGRARAV